MYPFMREAISARLGAGELTQEMLRKAVDHHLIPLEEADAMIRAHIKGPKELSLEETRSSEVGDE